ncbi:Bifunctional IPC transferase and DIPP synthase [subsurface metagenome]
MACQLGSLTAIRPKVLLPVNGKEHLIGYPIEALAAAGVRDIAIVVGYLGDSIIEALGNGDGFGVRLQYVYNPDYLGGNAVSVSKVRAWAAGEPFVLCMGDHLIDGRIVKRLLDRQNFNETLCVDFAPADRLDFAEATKVVVDSSGYITHIGKELAYWDGLDTGVFLLTEKFLDAIDELFPRLGTDVEISDVTRLLVSRGHHFDTCDVSGCFWADVDTKEDLDMVRG